MRAGSIGTIVDDRNSLPRMDADRWPLIAVRCHHGDTEARRITDRGGRCERSEREVWGERSEVKERRKFGLKNILFHDFWRCENATLTANGIRGLAGSEAVRAA